MTTAFHHDPRYDAHTLPHHVESAVRLQGVINRIEGAGLLPFVLRIDGRMATDEELLMVHTQAHLDLLKRISAFGQPAVIDNDTYMLPASYEIARQVVGAAFNVVDAVMTGKANNGLVAVRPPGHHATPSQAMGFCLLSNIALAARYAQQKHGLRRVAIVDFDVHHGNGTQDVFIKDGSVLFISTHQAPLYPGTGHINEIGRGDGQGSTLNIPLRAGTGDEHFDILYKEVVLPALQRFAPQLILISAGFDSHWRDPLASLRLSLSGYANLALMLRQAADDICDGKLIALMEGGYDVEALSYGMTNLLRILLRRDDEIEDPLGKQHQRDYDIMELVGQLKALHQL